MQKTLAILLVVAILPDCGSAEAQSNLLPQCASAARQGNCSDSVTFPNGAKYVGEFRDGKLNGQGTFTWASGNKYVGEYRDDKRTGQGTYYSANGDKYVGEYRDDKAAGQGTYYSANGDKYVGESRDNKLNGQGTFTWASGAKYVGEYRDGKRAGQGTYYFANGDKYVGEYRDNKRTGQGTYTWANGSQQVGYWNDDQYVGAAPPTNYQSVSPPPQAASPPPQAAVADPLVAAIQALLSALGFEPGAADGVNGPQTAKAIALFQTAIGDKVDGQPSGALRTKLQKAVAERSVSPPSRAAPEPRKQPAEVVSSGTGFFIGRDVIVTNHHVIDGCTELRTRRSGADIGRARVVAVNKSDDLAALKSDTASDSFLELRVGSPPLKPAESVLVFGYPLSGALSSSGNTTLGNITALTGLRDDSRFIQISAAVQPGNSGGPVLDDAGRLVAVVQGKLDAIKVAKVVGDIPQNVNFAIRSSTLSNFLEANQIPYEVAAKADTLPSTKVAERASATSVQIHCLK